MKANLKTWPATPVEASLDSQMSFQIADLSQLLLSKGSSRGRPAIREEEVRGQRSEVGKLLPPTSDIRHLTPGF